jgi:hypothetical protein
VVRTIFGGARTAVVLAAACGLAALLGTVLPAGAGGEPLTERQERERCLERRHLPRYTVYSLGASFDGLARTTTIRNCEVPGPGPYAGTHPGSVAWNSTVVYGSCTPEGFEGGCGPPLEIQSWPQCDRDYSLYGTKEPASALRPATSFRLSGSYKIPTAAFERGISNRIELYTGQTTVIVFTDGPGASDRAIRSAHALARKIAPRLRSLSARRLRQLAVSTRGCHPG